MAMTGVVKDELSRVQVIKPCCRKAEVSTLLRFAGGLHLSEGTGRHRGRARHRRGGPAAAREHHRGVRPPGRVPRALAGRPAQGQPLPGPGEQGQAGESLARQAGLIDAHGRPVRGPAPAGGVRFGVRLRGRLAGCVPGPRLADRAGPLDGARDHLPRVRGGARPGRRRPAAEGPRQGPRRARGGPGGDQGRRGDRRHADQAGRAPGRAGLGGAPDAPRGPGHRQPAGQLRRRQPAPQRARRGGGGRAGGTCPGDPRPGRAAAPRPWQASCGWRTGRPAWRNSASSPTRR